MHSRLSLGRMVITSNAKDALDPSDVITGLSRHAAGDWGYVCGEDRQANEDALINGGRVLSVYEDRCKVRFWVITEWDRSATTVLLPEDY